MIRSITGGNVFVGESGFQKVSITIDSKGKIQTLSNDVTGGSDTIHLDEKDVVLPGRIDSHIHGAGGFDVMDASQQSLKGIAETITKEGTTSFLPTTMTSSSKSIENALIEINTYVKKTNNPGCAEVIGIHLEGPFISPDKMGAQNPDHIQQPDIHAFWKWHEASGGHIKVVTLAPEVDGAIPFIQAITEKGVVASIGHSNATYEEVLDAITAGASQFTHLYNAMRPMHHREPGVLGAAFLRSETIAELIVDGQHCSPEMIQFAFGVKGKEGLMLITDAMRAKCLGDGTYDLGGQGVTVMDGKATLADGTLAGSVLTMQEAFLNMRKFTKASIADLVFMTSINPARQYGVFDRKGSIEIGKDADLIVLDGKGELKMTICRGWVAFRKEGSA